MTAETIYDTTDGVEEYAAMAEGYDGRTHVARLAQLLPPGADVLELGMGPGVDLDLLAKTFTVVGSDQSQAFLDRYARIRPGTELLKLDAVTIDTDRRFDAIYSNKVLHHLTTEELRRSFKRQAEVLRPGGLLLHGIWAGTSSEDHAGLHDQRYMPETIKAVVPASLEIAECRFYREMDNDDSLRIVLRLKQDSGDTQFAQGRRGRTARPFLGVEVRAGPRTWKQQMEAAPADMPGRSAAPSTRFERGRGHRRTSTDAMRLVRKQQVLRSNPSVGSTPPRV